MNPSLASASLTKALSLSAPELPAGPLRLDKNENAYGPSEKSISAMQSVLNLSNRYPSLEIDELVGKIAVLHKVKPEQVTIGAGSIEILRMAAHIFLSPGKKLLIASPTFNVIADFASALRSEVVIVPLTKSYAHDLDAILERANGSTGLIYICNPNNPTGTLTVRTDLEGFLRKIPGRPCVLIDEAYHHYVQGVPSAYTSFIDHPVDDDRVIVARTFSTIYGLAGARVGYAVSSPQFARSLSQGRLPFGVNLMGARAAAAALDDGDYVRLSAKRNTDDRQEFFNQANVRMNRWIDSHTNFVMMKGGLPAPQILEHFQKHNILLGPLVTGMSNYIRVSLGTPKQMLDFWRVWDMLPPHGMPM
jgi:histidinol-phosphate aminotransferase